MEWISTKNMKNEDAPNGVVLVKYLELCFGGWNIEYCLAYFDNPNDYEDNYKICGWTHNNTENKINVLAYCILPITNNEKENPFINLSQKDIFYEYGTYHPNLGNIGI